jgi:hypothetical protein
MESGAQTGVKRHGQRLRQYNTCCQSLVANVVEVLKREKENHGKTAIGRARVNDRDFASCSALGRQL